MKLEPDTSEEALETCRFWARITGQVGRPVGTMFGCPIYEVDSLVAEEHAPALLASLFQKDKA